MDITRDILLRDTLDLAQKFDLFNFRLYVSGIEVTQATQHFDDAEHLTDAADRGADNAIRLVANKPAWVRVYVSSFFGSGTLTGTLELQRRHLGFLWTTIATLNPTPPLPASVDSILTHHYAQTRETLSKTLNFIIPASEMIGTLRLVARVSSESRHAERTIVVPVTLRQTLRLAGVMVAYNGPASMAPNAPNLTIAAPTVADLQAMAGTALTLFPVRSAAEFRSAGSLTLTHHLQDTSFPASGCGTGWNDLNASVAAVKTADGNRPDWIYYGLLPNGVPMGPVGGCGGGGVATGPIGNASTLAHEAGHACGLAHAPSGGAPNADPNYPAYEPYDSVANRQASIGEYGLDINNGNIASPQTFHDIMGYAFPKWISPYHYNRLLQNARLSPVTVGIDHVWWKDLVLEERRKWPWIPFPDPRDDLELELPVYPPAFKPQDMISLIVRIARGAVAEVLHVARTRMHAELDRSAATPFTARLIGDAGEVLAEATLRRLHTADCGCGCNGANDDTPPQDYIAQVLLADVAPGAALEISQGDKTVWQRKSPGKPPRVEGLEAKADRRGNLQVQWSAVPEATGYWLRWSRDGELWTALATGMQDAKASIDGDQLPSGDVLLQVVAHDGFHSTASKPLKLNLPERAAHVAIHHPLEGRTYAEGQTLRLWGSANATDGTTVEDQRCTWLLDRNEIAQGLDAWTTLSAGEHKLTLRVATAGGKTEVSVAIQVRGNA